MNKDYVRIYLAENETGWAKPIQGKLAQIASVPYSGNVGWEDIVELSHAPGKGPSLPTIAKVILKSGLATTILQYERPAQGYQLMNLLALLGGGSDGMFPPEAGKPGLLAVAHPDGIKPIDLALAIGIPQPLAGTSLVEKLEARWPGDNTDPMSIHEPPDSGRLALAPRPDEGHDKLPPETYSVGNEALDESNDDADLSQQALEFRAATLQGEVTKAGIRIEVSEGGTCLDFPSGEDLLAFVAMVTSGGPGDLYWNAMDYHPDFDAFESSWLYYLRPVEQNFELVETGNGKRWCRVLGLEFSLCIPEKDVLEITVIFGDHNLKAAAEQKVAGSPPA